MPPKQRYTPESVLDAALRLTRAQGIDAVSARAVAAELGSSVAPIFSCYASMDALHEAIMDALIARFVEGTERGGDIELGGDPLFAAGFGMVRFAAREPRFYEALFLRPHGHHHKFGAVRRAIAARMADHPRYADLDDAARFGLVGRSSVVVHGLGVEVYFGRLPDPSDLVLTRLLEQLAGPLVEAALANGWTRDIHAPPRRRARAAQGAPRARNDSNDPTNTNDERETA